MASSAGGLAPHSLSTRSDRLAFGALLLAAALFWTWLGFAVHTMPVVGGESDLYVDRAADALAGNVTRDAFHPLGLPLLIAGVAWFGLDVWDAGRLVAIGFGLLFVAFGWLLARRFVSAPLATLATVAVVASEHVLVGAVQVCTDVPAAAAMAAALWAWSHAAGPDHAKVRWLFGGGLALGLAGTLRMPSLALAPAFLPLLFGVGNRERLRRALWTAMGGALGLLPHKLIGWWYPTRPLDNLAQVVWKYRYMGDDEGFLAYVDRGEPFPWREAPAWLWQGLGDLLGYLGRDFGAPWSLGLGALAIGVSALLVAAMLLPLWRVADRRAAFVVAVGGWSVTIMLCLLSLPRTRLTVPTLLPAVVLLAAAGATRNALRRRMALTCTGALAATALLGAPASVQRFGAAHPEAEVRVARALIGEHGAWLTIATPAFALPRYVDCFRTDLPQPPRLDADAAEHWRLLLDRPAVLAADFLVVGKSGWPDFARKLAEGLPADRYRIVRDDDVLVLAPIRAVDWCAAATAKRRGADLELAVQLGPAVDKNRLVGVGYLFRDHAGNWHRLTLAPEPDGGFRLRVPGGAAFVTGDVVLRPAMLTVDGAVWRGPLVAVQD